MLGDALTGALQDVLAPKTILFRNDSAVRNLEGLTQEVRIVGAELGGPIEVLENGGVFQADPRAGQKTGWFYDQRDNRAFVAALAKGKRVADFYSPTRAASPSRPHWRARRRCTPSTLGE